MTGSNRHRELTKCISQQIITAECGLGKFRPLSCASLLLAVAFMTGLNSSARAQALIRSRVRRRK